MILLKEGSKTQSLNTSDDNLGLEINNSLQPSGRMESATKMKQMFLNSNLQLQTTGVENRVNFTFKKFFFRKVTKN